MQRKLGMLGALVFTAVFFAVTGMAQIDIQNKMTVNVPYSFQAGDKTWPPGDYSFIVNPNEHRVQMIESSTSDSVFLTGTPSNKGTAEAPGQGGNRSADNATESGTEKYYITLDQVGNTYHLQKLQGRYYAVEFRSPEKGGNVIEIQARGDDSGTPH